MMRRPMVAALALALAGLAAGCGGDIGARISSDAALRGKVIDAFAGSGALADQAVTRLLAVDSTRAIVVAKVMADAAASQEALARAARDPALVDDMLGQAVRDSVMKTHVLTLLKGMQMAEAPRR